jgi:hypothetical protein
MRRRRRKQDERSKNSQVVVCRKLDCDGFTCDDPECAFENAV